MEFYAAVKTAFPDAENCSVSMRLDDYDPRGVRQLYDAFLHVGSPSKCFLSAGSPSPDKAIASIRQDVDKHNLEEKFRREFNERYAQAITSEVRP